MRLLDPTKVDTIIVHCSASEFGDVETITSWHKDRGWDTIGYHWVVTNCYPTSRHFKEKQPDPNYDGVVHKGRSEQFAGAHASGVNWRSIGICIIGDTTFTSRQLDSTMGLIDSIQARYSNTLKVIGHYEVNEHKTCPNIDIEYFNSLLLFNDSSTPPVFDPSILGRLI